MGLLDFIFGNDDDDLEATEPKHPLESVPGWSRPMGASTNDPQVGEDDAGNPVFRTALGRTYTVRVNPDQRTIRQKVTDAAPAVVDAVKDYAQNPTLPTKEQVGQFAYNATIGAAEDLDNIMFKGEGTIGDALSLASGVGLGARGANIAAKALTGDGIVPEGEPGTVLGLFLPAYKNPKYQSNVTLADKMKANGASRDEIWNKTGLWQLAESGHWLTEIDDSNAEIALTAKYNKTQFPKQYKTETVIEKRPTTSAASREDRISAKVQVRKNLLEIQKDFVQGLITEEEAKRLAMAEQIRLDDLLNSKTTSFEEVEVTKQVEIPRKELTVGRGPHMKGGKSTLDEVLFHDDFFAEMSEMGIDATKATAEAGRRKKDSVYGEHWRTEPDWYQDKNRINAYKNAANAKLNPRNDADRAIVDKWKKGEIPPEQADAEMILSTMLHEVQHLIDRDTRSDSGRGFNSDNSPQVRDEMRNFVDKKFRRIVNLEPPIQAQTALSLMHELIYNPVEVEDIIGGTLMAPAQTTKFSVNEILDSVYGLENSYAKSQITELGNVKNIQTHHVHNLGEVFDKYKHYLNIMENFPPDDPRHKAALRDAKQDFIDRVSGTMPADKPSADYVNANAVMPDMAGPNNVENKRARANVMFHLLDSGELDDVMDNYFKLLRSGEYKNVTSASDSELYYLEGGEVKSRLVQARRDMTAEERKATPPYKMLDRDEERIWFVGDYLD